MPRRRIPVTQNDKGEQRHPAFGMARIGRIMATPGEVLFQSDLRHRAYISVTVSTASRQRELKRDWVHAEKVLCQFSMSMAQFASFVSSAGTEGVPVTLDYYAGETQPGITYEPRLGVSLDETRAAAEVAFNEIALALGAYEDALATKAPAAVRKRAMGNLQAAVRNAPLNVEYAAQALTEHAEEVVEKSRADLEALVASATQVMSLQDARNMMLGITAAEE